MLSYIFWLILKTPATLVATNLIGGTLGFNTSCLQCTNKKNQSLVYDAQTLWNELPDDIQTAVLLSPCKYKLKTRLFSKAYPPQPTCLPEDYWYQPKYVAGFDIFFSLILAQVYHLKETKFHKSTHYNLLQTECYIYKHRHEHIKCEYRSQ